MMNKIIILNGPNLNLLGEREKEKYGNITLKDIENNCKEFAKKNNINLSLFQSNVEGELVGEIQKAREEHDGLIINAGGYTHTSVAILDALRAFKIPKIEIHLSNIYNREDYRKKSITSAGVNGIICGFGYLSYVLAIEALSSLLNR